MPEPATPVQFTGPTTVEDVMAALAKQSIFDLPTLVGELVKVVEEHAGQDDEPDAFDLYLHPNYFLVHSLEAMEE